METSNKRLVTELLRAEKEDFTKLEELLPHITEEEFVSMGLGTVINGWQRGYSNINEIKEIAEKYPWLRRVVTVSKLERYHKDYVKSMTLEDLVINMSNNTYKEIHYTTGIILYTHYIKRNEDFTQDEQLLVSIMEKMSLRDKKALYNELNDNIVHYAEIQMYQNKNRETAVRTVKQKESYKQVLATIIKELEGSVKRPSSAGEVIVDPYGVVEPHFIGWDVSVNQLIEEMVTEGYIETVEKYKLSTSQRMVYEKLKRDGFKESVDDEDLVNRWETYVESLGGIYKLYHLVSKYEGRLKEAKNNKQAEGKKGRSKPVGFDFKTPLYKVVRLNYKSKARVTEHIKVGDTLQLEYAGEGSFTVVVNGIRTELLLKETEIHNSFNIRLAGRCIFDLELAGE